MTPITGYTEIMISSDAILTLYPELGHLVSFHAHLVVTDVQGTL